MAMNQRTRSLATLAALLAVAGGAGLFAYYGVYQKQEKEKAAKETKEKVFADLDKAKLSQLTVTAKGQTTVLARSKQPEGWKLVSPVSTAADSSAVDSLLTKMSTLKQKSVVEEKAKDLAKYGLEKPTLKVVARAEDGKELTLRVGDEIGFDNTVYVATGESADVLQAEGGLKGALEKSTFDLRDKRVLPFEDADLSALDVTIDGSAYSLKKVEGKWQVVGPFTDRADEQTVNRVLSALRSLRATQFVTDTAQADDLSKHNLAKPRLEVAMTLAGGGRMTLAAAQAGDGAAKKTYARRHEATFIVEIPESIFTDAAVKIADLRDKSLLSFEKDKVSKAVFSLGSESVTIERKKAASDAGTSGDDWAITGPTPGEARKWKMNSVLWGLSSLKGTSIVEENAADLAKYGLDKPAKAVTLFDGAGKELGTVAFGKENGDKMYARNTGGPKVFEIEKAKAGELPSARADLEEPKPAAADAGTAK